MRLISKLTLFLSILLSLVIFMPSSEARNNSVTLTAADYAKLPEISQLAISPKGERLAFRRTSEEYDLIIVINLQTSERVGMVNVAEVKPSFIYFVDEDKVVLITETNQKISGFRGRHDISTAAVYNVETNKVHRLLEPGDGIYRGQSSIGRIVGISEDGKEAYMPAWESEGVFSLFRANLVKDRPPRKHQKGRGDVIDFFMGSDGETLVRERYNNKTNIHKVEIREGRKWRVIFEEETDIRRFGFSGLTPARDALIVSKQNPSTGRFAYYKRSLDTGTLSEPIFSKTDKDVESIITDLNRIVYGVRYSGFTPTYEFFDEKLNARMKGMEAALPDQGITIVDYTPDWSKIVFLLEGGNTSGIYVLYQDGNLNFIAAKRDFIPNEFVHGIQDYQYTARDGMIIPSLLTLPNNKPAKNLPAILFPHGGPEAYDRKGFDYMAQYFASQGYAVIQPQFRGATGFGPEHRIAGRGEWGKKMQDDLTDAISDLVEKGTINPERVCIVGASYGGYAALAGATFTPDVYKCAVSINGVSDVERMMKTDRREYGKNHWVVSYWEKVISQGNVDEDHLETISPINHIDNIDIPVLLIHGERDNVVKFRQSKNMANKLEDANKVFEFVKLEKGDHHLSSAENRMNAMLAIDRFLKEHL